ncbi:hypothetical protein M5K25_010508 [Dendrobium thyrsiflorum]|uniref:Uncharacterized protein n=1 Tax=Dendrobium thyrsiflorum TaxID=117978 RepID=A0ABD0UZU6_DENTH
MAYSRTRRKIRRILKNAPKDKAHSSESGPKCEECADLFSKERKKESCEKPEDAFLVKTYENLIYWPGKKRKELLDASDWQCVQQ